MTIPDFLSDVWQALLGFLATNWLVLLLALIAIGALAFAARAYGGVGRLGRAVLGRLRPLTGGFEGAYLAAIADQLKETPALLARGDVQSLGLIRAFALLRLEVPGLDRGGAGPDDDPFRELNQRLAEEPGIRRPGNLLARLRDAWAARSRLRAPANAPGGAIWLQQRLLILGRPGSGKTTLLRHVALIAARDLLGETSRAQENGTREIYGWPRPLFPVYIPLRRLVRACPDWQKHALLDAYAGSLGAMLDGSLRCRPGWFRRRLRRGDGLVLIDGFDELRDQPSRDAMAGKIRELFRELNSRSATPRCRIVVAGRPIGYEGQLDGDFSRRELAPLNQREVQALVKARYQAIHEREQRGGWSPEEKARRLNARLGESPGLIELSRNPLLLALIVGIHHTQADGELPEKRYQVYEQVVSYLLTKWEQRRATDAGEVPASDRRDQLEEEEKLRLVANLAWKMFEQAPDSQMHGLARREQLDAHLIISRGAAVGILKQSLIMIFRSRTTRPRPDLEHFCEKQARVWLSNLGSQGGLLQGESGDESSDAPIQFAHKSLQEYLAAQEVVHAKQSNKESQLDKTLLNHRHLADWHEVIRFYAASHDAKTVVEDLMQKRTPSALLLAGWCLYERPRYPPPPQLQETVCNALRDLLGAPADQLSPDESAAALQLVESLVGLDPTQDRALLVTMARQAAGPTVRARACALLGEAAAEPQVAALLAEAAAGDADYRVRLAAGAAVAPHDSRFQGAGLIPTMVEVPGGPFLMGSGDADKLADSDEKPQHQLDLPAFWIGIYPVTVAQWRAFAEGDGYTNRAYWTAAGWAFLTTPPAPPRTPSPPRRRLPFGIERLLPAGRPARPTAKPASSTPYRWRDPGPQANNLPVVNISWYEAVAYCRWLSTQTGQSWYLPSEAAWEKAARGPQGWTWPWGADWEEGRCNSKELGLNRTSPVGSFPLGVSPYGAHDMAGNVWEWCATRYGKGYPYDTGEDEWAEAYLEGNDIRRIRGGAFYWDKQRARGAYRNVITPRSRVIAIGLRVARRSPGTDSES